jgi:hypothetical protein
VLPHVVEEVGVRMAAPRSVNRCIAVAAHGRRCQQTTYRGSPYCWHHTQSRKVWAPSRMQAGARRPLPAAGLDDVPVAPVPLVPPPVATEAELASRIAESLSREQLEALAAFLASGADGVFRLEVVDGQVTGARRDARLSRGLARRAGP